MSDRLGACQVVFYLVGNILLLKELSSKIIIVNFENDLLRKAPNLPNFANILFV